jgi:hypothetical protein
MRAICSSEMSVNLPQTSWRYIAENRAPHNDLCENLKSYIIDKIVITLHYHKLVKFVWKKK